MQDAKTWNMISKQLIGDETSDDKDLFLKWFEASKKNEELFNKVKNVWDDQNNISESHKPEMELTFLGRFTLKKIQDFILKKALGNLVGFIIGLWITASFSHYVLEKRGLKNLFGLTGRKKITVNEIPEWIQSGIAILVGFISLELINHFFQTKKYLILWAYLKKMLNK